MSTNFSIFNDIIGPVMRGPSSSHTAASWRIARVCVDILNEQLKTAIVEFDENGAWAANYREQGTVMGINGGLLGIDVIDDRMKYTESLARETKLEIRYKISSFPTKHTNTIRLSLEGEKGKRIQFIAVSVGGGSFEIQQIDNFQVNIRGNYFEILIWSKKNGPPEKEIRKSFPKNTPIFQSSDGNKTLINVKSPKEISHDIIKQLKSNSLVQSVNVIKPVLPIVSGNERDLPFNTIDSLLLYAEKKKLDLGEVGLIYEESISGLSRSVLIKNMKNIIKIIEESIKTGLKGTTYKDRILDQQSHFVDKAEKDGRISQNSVVNKIISYVSAIMEAKSAMEVIAANPTAGSCGTVGGALKALADNLLSTSDDKVKAYFASGIIGVYFAKGPGFSAEEYGCQVECGAASGMAAAGIVQLMGGSAREAINAASLAIQNMIGLICDPVADRVEVPCLGKNISAAMNALSSATMARSGFDVVIPLEEVIQTVIRVGNQMPACVKCTGLGGLAITDTSVRIKKQLKKQNTEIK